MIKKIKPLGKIVVLFLTLGAFLFAGITSYNNVKLVQKNRQLTASVNDAQNKLNLCTMEKEDVVVTLEKEQEERDSLNKTIQEKDSEISKLKSTISDLKKKQ